MRQLTNDEYILTLAPTERTIIAELSPKKTAEDAYHDVALLRKYRGGSLPTPEYWAGLRDELRDWLAGIERLGIPET